MSNLNNKEEDKFNSLFHQPLDRKNHDRPYLIIDVNINDHEVSEIPVYEGDQAKILARNFALEHNLTHEEEINLKTLIENQIKGVLTRIDETDNEDTTNNF